MGGQIMFIVIISLIVCFLLGMNYGRCIERKKMRGINIKKPIEWIKW